MIALDSWLKARNAKFRVPVLAAAIGIYLPLELMVPIFLGGLLAYLVERRLGIVDADHDTKDRAHRKGVLFSAGLITGEALMGIIMAIPIVVTANKDVMALPESLQLGAWLPGATTWPAGAVLGLVLIGGVAWLLYRTSIKPQA